MAKRSKRERASDNKSRISKEEDKEVHRPAHYNDAGIEAIDAIRAALGEEDFRAYCRGNAVKYLWRCEHKGNKQQDLEKAQWYSAMAAGDDPRKRSNPQFVEIAVRKFHAWMSYSQDNG